MNSPIFLIFVQLMSLFFGLLLFLLSWIWVGIYVYTKKWFEKFRMWNIECATSIHSENSSKYPYSHVISAIPFLDHSLFICFSYIFCACFYLHNLGKMIFVSFIWAHQALMENKQNKTKCVKKENINHTRLSLRAFILFCFLSFCMKLIQKKKPKSDEINAKMYVNIGNSEHDSCLWEFFLK